jgi:hypothetical protein
MRNRFPRPVHMVAGGLLTIALTVTAFTAASTSAAPSLVGTPQVVNVSDQSFGVAFFTTAAAKGGLIYGPSCSNLNSTATETPSNGLVHLVNTTGSLTPGTAFAYKPTVNGTPATTCFSLTSTAGTRAATFKSQSIPPAPATIYGQVQKSGCVLTQPQSLVLLTVKHGTTSSAPLAAIADSSGKWALPFGDTTDASGRYITPRAADIITTTAYIDATHHSADMVSYDGTAQIIGPRRACV